MLLSSHSFAQPFLCPTIPLPNTLSGFVKKCATGNVRKYPETPTPSKPLQSGNIQKKQEISGNIPEYSD